MLWFVELVQWRLYQEQTAWCTSSIASQVKTDIPYLRNFENNPKFNGMYRYKILNCTNWKMEHFQAIYSLGYSAAKRHLENASNSLIHQCMRYLIHIFRNLAIIWVSQKTRPLYFLLLLYFKTKLRLL